MILHLFKKNDKFYQYFKVITTLLIAFIFFNLDIGDVFMGNGFNQKYKKIKEFDGTSFISFLKNFFINKLSYFKKFREINCKNILLNVENFTKNENPDVSVIITVYNQSNCFYSALRSVQNQSLKNIEIIIIDDCSLDNSIEEIKKYMKEDDRIILLQHQSNDGKIKSRSDGVRMAKGKYITIIDGDDSLSDENILYNSFSIATLAEIDVVGFGMVCFTKKQFKSIINYKIIKGLNNRIIYQPELYYKFVNYKEKNSDFAFINRNIVSRLIKNDVFKRVLEYIGPKFTEDHILDYEDTIMAVSLFRTANSYFQMRENGYYYSNRECENSFPYLNFKKCKPKNFWINNELDPIKYLNFLLDKYKKNEIENFLLYKELVAVDSFKRLNTTINSNFSYVYLIIDKIYQLNFQYKCRKDEITKIKDKLVKKENLIKFENSNLFKNKFSF